MPWHYQVRQRIDHANSVSYFDIVEVYTEHDVALGHGQHAIAPVGRTLRELLGCLEDMVRDARKYHIITESIDATQAPSKPSRSTPTTRREASRQQLNHSQEYEKSLRQMAEREEDGE